MLLPGIPKYAVTLHQWFSARKLTLVHLWTKEFAMANFNPFHASLYLNKLFVSILPW